MTSSDATPDELFDDSGHPITSVDTLDLHGIKTGGGSDLVLVIASPLRSDERSQRRLLGKIANYVRYLSTPDFLAASGVPTPENTSIVVHIHSASDPEIFELLERCRPWIADNDVSLQVEFLIEEPEPGAGGGLH